jgi:hypothetical protein
MKLNQKGIGIIETLLILILLTIVGFTGYYVWHTQKNSDSSYNNASKSIAAKPVPSSGTEASDLKTYSNTNYGLTFKYSPDVSVKDTTGSMTGSGDNFPWYEQTDYVKLSLEFSGLGNTVAKLVVNDDDLQKTIGSMGGSGTISRTYDVNGHKAYYITGYGNGGIGSPGVEYVVEGPNYSFVLSSENNVHKTTLDALIETVELK